MKPLLVSIALLVLSADATSARRILLPVWHSSGSTEQICAGFLSANGRFIPLFRKQNTSSIPSGYWIEEFKWRFIERIEPDVVDIFDAGPDSLEHENCRLLRIAPRARVESNVVLERKRHLTAHATTSKDLPDSIGEFQRDGHAISKATTVIVQLC